MGSPPDASATAPVHVTSAIDDDLTLHRLRNALDPFASAVEVLGATSPRPADVMLVHTAGIHEQAAASAAAAVATGRPILVISDRADERDLLRMLRIGVRGFLVEPVEPRELLDAIVAVSNGELALDPTVASRAALLAARLIDLDRPPAELLGLSKREVQVLDRLAEGATAREVGAALFVSHETVRSHLKRIYRKLGVHDREAALRRAREEGVLSNV